MQDEPIVPENWICRRGEFKMVQGHECLNIGFKDSADGPHYVYFDPKTLDVKLILV